MRAASFNFPIDSHRLVNSSRPATADKAALRARLRRRRRALSAAEQALAAAGLAAQLRGLPAFARARRVAFYRAFDGEIDPGPALAEALARGAKCYLPVVGEDKILRFAAVTVGGEFRAGKFGIAEPVVDADGYVAAADLDLALLPLVGFDGHGNRLGMGGGFYDATFAGVAGDGDGDGGGGDLSRHTRGPRLKHCGGDESGDGDGAGPALVGLAHEVQRVDSIAVDAWDIPLSAVVTERRVYDCATAVTVAVTDATVTADTVTVADSTVIPPTVPEKIPCATG